MTAQQGRERREHKKPSEVFWPRSGVESAGRGEICVRRKAEAVRARRGLPDSTALGCAPCPGENSSRLPHSAGRSRPLQALRGCCRGKRRARTRHFKQGERAALRSTAPGGSCPRKNAARIPRCRPRHPARELPGAKEGSGGERAAVGVEGVGTEQGVPRELRRRPSRTPPTALPSGSPPAAAPTGRGRSATGGAGRGRGQRGDSGRAPIRGGPSRALPGAVCRRPPGLRREPIRGRLPARGAEGTQERRGRRSLPP